MIISKNKIALKDVAFFATQCYASIILNYILKDALNRFMILTCEMFETQFHYAKDLLFMKLTTHFYWFMFLFFVFSNYIKKHETRQLVLVHWYHEKSLFADVSNRYIHQNVIGQVSTMAQYSSASGEVSRSTNPLSMSRISLIQFAWTPPKPRPNLQQSTLTSLVCRF